MYGLIYKITNNINGKIYIGQTYQTLENRWKKHIQQIDDGSYFHNSLKKYGIENFSCEILEENIDESELNNKEIYYISKFNSFAFAPNSNGYNTTKGGNNYPAINAKLNENQIKEIQELLINTDLSEIEIASKYNITFFAISDINRGKSWYNKDLNYPLRRFKRDVSESMFLEIIEMLKTRLFSHNYISNKFNIASSTICYINTGIYTKYKYPENLNFPISKISAKKDNIISTQATLELLKDFLVLANKENKNLNKTKQLLAEKYHISINYVKIILRNQGKKPFLLDLIYPLINNKEINLQLIENKLITYNKYK